MIPSIILLLPFFTLITAKNLEISKHLGNDCFYCCIGTLGVTFGDVPASLVGDYYGSKLGSKLFLSSAVACIDTYCKPSSKQYQGAHIEWEEYIEKAAAMNATLPTIEQISSQFDLSSVPAVDCREVIAAGTIVNNTIIPSQENYDWYMKTELTWNKEVYLHHTFGYALYFLLSIMVLIGLTGRFFSWLSHRQLPTDAPSMRSEVAPSTGPVSNFYTTYMKHLGVPALFGHKHATPAYSYFSIPTRLQGLFIFIYVALNVIFCAVGYEVYTDNAYWPGDISTQIWRYVADRTGIICFWNLPLLWLFAGRNDFLLWITGWSFSQTNLMHRWVARIATLQAIVHSIAYTWLEKEYLASSWAELYWRAGVFATVFMALLLPLSMLPLRKHAYEIFLIVHILVAAVLLPLLWHHVDIFEGEYAPFVWACVGIWVFDRVARFIRLGVLSHNAFTGQNATAVVTGNENGLIRLSVDTPFKIDPKPGQYYFLYHPRSLTPWENHPFTLASWEQGEESTRLHFLIAVQSGATRRLRRKLVPGQATSMRILLEGPYGHQEPVERYEHVLFVAGGSGITAVLPYIDRLRNHAFTRSVTVIWSVKNNAYASDVLSGELRNCGAEVQLHITEEEQSAVATLKHGQRPLVEATDKDLQPESKSTDSGSTIKVTIGRPVMDELVSSHAKRLLGSEKLAIVACGPHAMMDDLRASVADIYGSKEGQVNGYAVDYYEELFSW